MAGRPRTPRAHSLVRLMLTVLRETGQPWTVEELLDRLANGPAYHAQMSAWQRAAARMAARDIRAHPHVVVDELGRLHYKRTTGLEPATSSLGSLRSTD